MSRSDPTHPDPLAAGKLPASLLAELLAGLPTRDPQLLLGPAVGEDAAVIDFGPGAKLLVAKSDPITFATDEIGHYAVHVCANDLAVTGAVPRFYLPTLLLPASGSDVETARRIFAQLGAACAGLGIVVAGGHSEVTPTVTQPVIAGTMLGEVARDCFVASAGCRPGDLLLMAGEAPIEGASIIARERRADLLARGWNPAQIDRAAGFLHTPGISVLAPAHAAAEARAVSAMHDPTEGGVATGLLELATAAQVGLVVDLDAIPLAPLAVELCATYGLDPLGTIASGALLAACAPDQVETLLAAWTAVGWTGRVVGHATADSTQRTAYRSGSPVPFPIFAVDEITKLWT
jgi:hydrogenase maturation factor